MADPAVLKTYFDTVDNLQDYYVERLKEAVAIKSYELADLGTHVMDGKTLKLPPAILGTYGNDQNKKTILVYGHYDVQPALIEDGWSSDPFELHETSKHQLIGRGASDDKGPVIGWLNAIEAHQKAGIEFPVNLKFCFEGMEECGSEGMDELVVREAKRYFTGVDAVCISDNYWLGVTKPCLTYGLRGISYFKITISGPGRDLHSGVFGGTVHEPMTDLFLLFSKLVSPSGDILIPGINDNVEPLTEEENKIYESIEFSMNEYHDAIGSKTTIYEDKIKTLQHRWRFPSLTIHGIEGAFSAPGTKTVLPAKITGKFSIRLVPNMEPDRINALVEKFLTEEFAKLGSKNTLNVGCVHGAKAWVSSPNHWNYVAAAKAIEKVFKVHPDYTREGGSIPITLTFQDALNKNVLLLPMGRGDDGAHSINEKLDRSNYIEGIKLFGAYLHEIAAIKAE
ncbi:16919_t:CDS:2 [Acaulospora colombiana]|uniref:16919_t:CDS:1 n=1 Tax=Acaulospora colombiana TaxID=27376 RepID=A0ACA9LRL2_9GLOM|nr:16919_t:CDS:2 [Acaulospora colombiana]